MIFEGLLKSQDLMRSSEVDLGFMFKLEGVGGKWEI